MRECGLVQAEAELGQGDQGVDVAEAEGPPGDQSDLGVQGFGQAVVQPGGQAGVDLGAMLVDLAGDVVELFQVGPVGLGQPQVELLMVLPAPIAGLFRPPPWAGVRRTAFHTLRRASSTATAAHRTTWKGSAAWITCGPRDRTGRAIQLAAS